MIEHHPDKLSAKGLPPEMIELAKQKTQEISGKRAKKQHQFILKQAIENQLGTYDNSQHVGADKIF